MLDLAGAAPAKRVSQPVGARAAESVKPLLSLQSVSPRLSTRRGAVHADQRIFSDNPQSDFDDAQPTPPANKPSERFAGLRRGLGARVSNLLGLANSGPTANLHVDAYANGQAPQQNADRYQPTDYPVYESGDDGEKPLVDLSILINTVWRYRGLIVATTVLGAIAGVFIALSTPHKYYAETRLFIDPREIRLTEDELRSPLMSTEAMIAMTDSQAAILTSTNVLIQVVDSLSLARDPEFNGSLNSGGISGGIALIKQLITGKDANAEAETEALSNLRNSLTVSRDPKTFVINIGITSREPEKSALISNAIVQTYLDSEGEAQSGLMERTSEAIDSRLESLRSDLNISERAVENFKAENDLISVGTELIDDQQITAINQQLGNARSTKVAVGVKADGLKKADVADVIDGAFPEEFLSANLIELRKQYSQSKSNADSLGSRLGPRHPQFIAANSTLESVKSQIRSELRRIVASSQSELQRAIETEQELASQLAVAKTRSLENSEELVTLRELDRKATATRQIYESFLKRSRETSERGNFNTQNARVISPAEAPLDPDSTSRKVIAIGGMMVGAVLGLGIAIMLGIIESIRSFLPGPDGGRRRILSGSPQRPGPQSDQRSASAPENQYTTAFIPGQPNANSVATHSAALSATGEATVKTENAEMTGSKNLIRDNDMNHYDPANYYAPYGQVTPQPMQPGVPPHMAYQGPPQYPASPAPYHGQTPYSGQGGYAPVQPQPVWQQVQPTVYATPQPVHPGNYPPAPSVWGYGHPQSQHYQQAAHYPAGWAQQQPQPQMQQQPVQQYAPVFYPQQPVPPHYYQQHPTQAPGTQQAGGFHAHPSSNNQRHEDSSDSEIQDIRQKMDHLRQRIDNKNRRRAG